MLQYFAHRHMKTILCHVNIHCKSDNQTVTKLIVFLENPAVTQITMIT